MPEGVRAQHCKIQYLSAKIIQICSLSPQLCGAVDLGLEAAGYDIKTDTFNAQEKHGKDLEEALKLSRKQVQSISKQLGKVKKSVEDYILVKEASQY